MPLAAPCNTENTVRWSTHILVSESFDGLILFYVLINQVIFMNSLNCNAETKCREKISFKSIITQLNECLKSKICKN